MGSYTEGISKRFAHTRIKDGYCVICGKFGKLTQDHVPPKSSIVITKVEQRHITEHIGANSKLTKGIKSHNGSKFKTICSRCNNNYVGVHDKEIGKVNTLVLEELRYLLYQPLKRDSIISIQVNALSYVKGMIGHILSATSVMECKEPIISSPYFDPLREFVIGENEELDSTHDLYYWFYPYSMHLSGKYVGFKNGSHLSALSILSFFPIAFMVTKKGQGIFPSHAKKLDLSNSNLHLDISPRGFDFAEFPFIELRGNQIMMLSDHQAICSYPIK